MKSYSLIPFLSAFISPALSTPTSSSYPTHGTDATYAHPANGICTDYLAKETVTWRKAIWDLPKFKDNFDIVAFQTAMGSLEASEVFHPISRYEDNVTSTYTLSGTFCKPKKMKGEKERTVLLATHGGGYDRRYWASTYMPEEYNFVQYALGRGYSVFYYDRIGTGKSQLISGYEAQGSNEAELVAALSKSIRNGRYTANIKASKLVLVGHSLGSVFSIGAINKYPEIAEAAILTGAALPNATDPSRYLRSISSILQNALLASSASPPYERDSAYLSFRDIYGHARAFFHAPYDVSTLKYAHSISQPASVLEMVASAGGGFDGAAYKGSVLLTTGEHDFLACGGHCAPRIQYGVQNATFSGAKKLETYLHPGAGHGVNFAKDVKVFYKVIVDFVDKYV